MIVALFLTSLVFGGLGAWLIGRHGARFGFTDEPNERSSHKVPTPKGGGIGILTAFLVAAIVVGIPLLCWLPTVIVAALSFLGDKLEFSVKFRLLSQLAAAAVVLVTTRLLHLSPTNQVILLVPMTIFVVGTANIYNFMDGINGIAAITGIVGFGLVGSYNFLSNGETAFTALSICLVMSCLGFLPFNFPNAKVFMGDVGSVLLGFVFAIVVIALSQHLLDFICLVSLLFPFYADELITMMIRIRKGENLLRAHRKHIYQLLANEKSIAHWKISIGYGLLQAAVGLSVLWIKPLGSMSVIFLLAVWFTVFNVFGALVRRSIA